MKLTIFLILLSVVSVFAGTSYSQTKLLNIEINNSTLKEVLKNIEDQSEFYFMYSEKFVDVERIVSVNVEDQKINAVLDDLFAGTDVGYKIRDRFILLTTPEVTGIELSVQQPSTIRGTVTNENGEPLIGVSVVIKGSTTGTITGADGNYSLNALNNDVLTFSYIGMKTQEIAVNNRTTINVVLTEQTIDLDEVLVTALGLKREKRAIGYSVSELGSAEILNSNATNIVSAIQGKVAGVAITTTTGQAGGNARITIRGNSSLNFNNQPLFVVDGIPFNNSENSIRALGYQGSQANTGVDIDPTNIESITVLKGASASALYGSQAANGVILITTKRGSSDQIKVQYSVKTSIDKIYEIPLQQSYAQGSVVNGVPTYFDGETTKTSDSWGPAITDVPGAIKYDKWAVFQNGHRTENNFDISGGNEKINYYAAYNNLNQQGTLKPIKFSRNNLFFAVNAKVNKRLDASIAFTYTRTDNDRLNEGKHVEYSFMNSLLDMPWTWNPFPIYDDDGIMRSWTPSTYNNPYWILDNTLSTNLRNRFLPRASLDFKIAEGLILKTNVGIDTYTNLEEDYINNTGLGATSIGRYNAQLSQLFNSNFDILMTYDKHLGKDFSINLMIGNNVQSNKLEYMRQDGSDLIIPGFKNLNNAQTINSSHQYTMKRSVSAYGQAVVDYKDMIYYTLTGRNDWSSTLPPENQSYFYHSHSLSFIFSNLIKRDIISFGKFRAAYSQVGNDAPPYSVNSLYISSGVGGLTWPFNGIGEFNLSTDANNPKLKSERTNEYEVGLQMKFFKNRLGFETSIYKKDSYDQIVRATQSAITGYETALFNLGQIQNKGVEFMAEITPVRTSDFSWNVILNWAANHNKVIKTNESHGAVQIGIWGLSIYEGYSFPAIELDYFLKDKNGNYLIDSDPTSPHYGYNILASRYTGITKPAGKVDPDWRGGINNEIAYKGFTLSAFVDMMFGGYIHNMQEEFSLTYGMSNKTEGRSSDGSIIWPGVSGYVDKATGELFLSGETNNISVDYASAFSSHGYNRVAEYKMQKSDYIKLREVTLSYNVPQELLARIKFVKNCTLTASGNNLWRWFDKSYNGADPEYNISGAGNGQGMQIYMFPSYRSYNFGVNLSF